MPTALLIIDVQNILCSGRNKAYAIDAVITRINVVSRKARNAGAMVIVVQHETQNGEMDYETESWKLAPQLEVHGSDVLLRKTGSDAFLRTGLQELLASRGIDKLVVCGVQSDFCVDSTVRRAMALGYPVTLVEDGHTTIDNGILSASQISQHHNKTLSSLESYGPRTTLVSAAEIHIEPNGADAPNRLVASCRDGAT